MLLFSISLNSLSITGAGYIETVLMHVTNVNTPASPTVSLALFMYTCSDFVMPLCRVLAYAITANGVCFRLFVLPLAQFYFFSASC